jgi:hypothetical protein
MVAEIVPARDRIWVARYRRSLTWLMVRGRASPPLSRMDFLPRHASGLRYP